MQAAVKTHRLFPFTVSPSSARRCWRWRSQGASLDEFPDGVWVFELAAVTDPAAVPDAVAAVLGITQKPGKSVSESVAAAMEGTIRFW